MRKDKEIIKEYIKEYFRMEVERHDIPKIFTSGFVIPSDSRVERKIFTPLNIIFNGAVYAAALLLIMININYKPHLAMNVKEFSEKNRLEEKFSGASSDAGLFLIELKKYYNREDLK